MIWWGALVGVLFGSGLLMVGGRVLAMRRTPFEVRVLPYLRDLPHYRERASTPVLPSTIEAVFGPPLLSAAQAIERVLGGSASIARRLERADLSMTVRDFRVHQVIWGTVAFVIVAVPSLVVSIRAPQRSVPLLIICLCAFAMGVLLRENRLTAEVAVRERRIVEEFPTIAELLALAVAAGESPAQALDRVTKRSHGAMSAELRRVLAQVRTGATVPQAFDALATRTGVPVVARFAEGLATAVERGTPLADVLHAQAADVREAGRRALIEEGARKEVLMMIPIVFVILPVTVVFAFWPGLVGLRLTS